MKRSLVLLFLALLFASPAAAAPGPDYFSRAGHADAWSGGVRMISDPHAARELSASGPSGSATIRGSGSCCSTAARRRRTSISRRSTASSPARASSTIYYDQLGSAYSDQPNDDRALDDRPLRRRGRAGPQSRSASTAAISACSAISWGGMLAMEYALAHQENLKCLIISNMMDSIPAYNDYADRVLMPAMDQTPAAPRSSSWRRRHRPRIRATWQIADADALRAAFPAPAAARVARAGDALLRPPQPRTSTR